MRKATLSAVLIVAVLLVGTGTLHQSPVRAQSALEVIASGLDNPRGLAFGPEGMLYVAEAGRGGAGPCITSSEPRYVCYGATGAITRVGPLTPGAQLRIITGLPSLAPAPGEAGAGTGATGPHDVGFLGRGNGWVTIGLGADPAKRALLGSAGAGFGRLARFQPNGNISFEDDLAGYEAANNPDGFVPDSNPYGLAVLASRRLVADAGGNALNEVSADGTISTLAVFPNRFVQNPFAAPGVTIPMQAVPTTVAMGPDGALYVGQLTGFPFPVGGANVYRVPPDGGTPTVVAAGFTNIIDIAFGPDGSLYVLELFANGILSGSPAGALTRVAPDGTRTSIVSKESMSLILPGGVAVGSDGSLYVTRFSTAPGAGDVVRIRP